MKDILTIYHGSDKIIEKPIFGEGKKHNDYGLGFYCTENIELAKEWAVSNLKNGFANCYKIDTKYLKILNLNTEEYSILNWIAILVNHRIFTINTPIANKAKKYLIDNFYINVNAYDLIIGYRADDSYFDYAEAFLNNSISVGQLAEAMKLGKLGEQIVIKSKYAFSLLEFQGFDEALTSTYLVKREKRNYEANNMYFKILEKDYGNLFIKDIMDGGITNDDSRIPRNVSK